MPRTQTATRRAKMQRHIDLYYALTIESWEWSYRFSAAGRKPDAERAYFESRHLHVGGTLSHPHKSSGRRINLAFVLSDDLLGRTAHLYQQLPDCVGTIHWGRSANAFEGVFSMPDQTLPLLLPMLAAGHLKYVLLQSNGPFRGHLDVGTYEFLPSLTADHFPEGQW